MSSMKPIDVFHVGPQKTGTTWVYQCLLEHPEVECPHKDATHYFSMLYHRGRGWLERQYHSVDAERLLFEPTFSYFRSPVAPIRIARENPHARIVACLRHPIARAFSHYWHEKKKRRFDFRFEEALENFDLFTNWIEPGFYALHLKRFLEHFPREQMLVQLFDDLEEDPWSFLQQLYRFIGVNDTFEPHVLHEKVNPATPRWLRFSTYRGNVNSILTRFRVQRIVTRVQDRLLGVRPVGRYIEHLSDVDHAVLEELNEVFAEDIAELEALLDVDLSQWRTPLW